MIKHNSRYRVYIYIYNNPNNFFFYLFSFLLTINLKLIKVHVEIKIVNKEAVTKRSMLLHAQCQLCMVTVPLNKAIVMLIRKGKRKEDN